MRGFSRILGEDKKKLFISKNARISTNFGVKPQKNLPKKQFLLTNSEVITIILEVSGLEVHSSGTEPVTFFGAQSSLGGHNSRLGGGAQFSFGRGGTSSDLGWHGLGISHVASGLLEVYSNLSNCNYRIFVEKMLLEIGIIEEMRTI